MSLRNITWAIVSYHFHLNYNCIQTTGAKFEEMQAKKRDAQANFDSLKLNGGKNPTKVEERMKKEVKKAEIDALVLIGGDGTFTGGMVFNQEFTLLILILFFILFNSQNQN